MGKIDDMRKLREKQFEEAERAALAGPKNGVAKNGIAHAPKPAAKSESDLDIPEFEDRSEPEPKKNDEPATEKIADGEKARCPECGKMKPVQNGVMAMHQKGMGKMCAGSRKPPA